MNKFTKATINTYIKKNPILASKYTYESFQIILSFNFILSLTSYEIPIQHLPYIGFHVIMSMNKYLLKNKENKRKKQRIKKTKERNKE